MYVYICSNYPTSRNGGEVAEQHLLPISEAKRVTTSGGAALLYSVGYMFSTSQRSGKWAVRVKVEAIFLGGEFIFSKINSSQVIP